MQLVKDQPSITLIGLNGNVQVELAIVAVHHNSAELTLASPDGRTIGRFDVIGDPNKEGAATLMFGGSRKRIVASTNLPGMLPTLDLVDEDGTTVAHLPTAILKTAVNAKAKPNSKKTTVK